MSVGVAAEAALGLLILFALLFAALVALGAVGTQFGTHIR